MKIQYWTTENQGLYIKLIGELDSSNVNYVEETTSKLIDKHMEQRSGLFYDLSELSYVDSSGLKTFIAPFRKLAPLNKKILFLSPTPTVDKVLSFAGLYNFMPKGNNPPQRIWIDVEQPVVEALIKNKLFIKMPAKQQNLPVLRNIFSAFVASENPTLEDDNDLKTVLSEAVTNSIVHGYDGKEGDIEVEATLHDKRVNFSVKDFGLGIEDISKAMQPFYTTKPEQERTGMGLTIMQTFTDALVVESVPGKGTTVRISKNLGTEK